MNIYQPKPDTGPRGGCTFLFLGIVATIGTSIYMLIVF